MREISLDRLRTLVAIADQGTFVRAARSLNLAPATVSLHIAELEARVGTPLLNRTRGQVQPTAAGDTLIARARQLLSDAEQALQDVQQQVLGLAGRVRLGASTGALAYLLPRALGMLAASHPGIDVQAAVLTSQDSLARLRNGTLDIGLVALPQSPVAGLALHAWRRDPVVAFVPSAWKPPQRLSPDWLAQRPLILNDASTRLSRQTMDWFAAAGHHPLARMQLNYNDAIKSLVAAGYGAAILPHEASAPAPGPGIVMRPLLPPLWRQLGIAHREHGVDAATRHVLDALQALPADSQACS